MCRERAGVVSETKPLPGHAIFARVGSGGRRPAEEETGAEEAAARWGGAVGG